MRTWNDIFNAKTIIHGKTITVGEQNFYDSTILVKEEDGNIVSCPMFIDEQGDIYFLYKNAEIYLKWL